MFETTNSKHSHEIATAPVNLNMTSTTFEERLNDAECCEVVLRALVSLKLWSNKNVARRAFLHFDNWHPLCFY